MGYSSWGHREEFLFSCLETHISVIWPYITCAFICKPKCLMLDMNYLNFTCASVFSFLSMVMQLMVVTIVILNIIEYLLST